MLDLQHIMMAIKVDKKKKYKIKFMAMERQCRSCSESVPAVVPELIVPSCSDDIQVTRTTAGGEGDRAVGLVWGGGGHGWKEGGAPH